MSSNVSQKVISHFILSFVILFLSFYSIELQSAVNICHLDPPKSEVVFDPKLTPSYWITVSPDGNWLAYMTVRGNFIIDVSKGSKGAIMKAPGKVDLQFSADQKFFTLVNKHTSEQRRLSFGVEHGTSWYSWSELASYFNPNLIENPEVWDESQYPHASRKVKRLAIDRTFYNHYHSMGVFQDASGTETHRILNDYRGASFRDYQWHDGKMTFKEPVYVTSDDPLVDGAGVSYIDLPMLSRDGKFFAGFNRQTMTTQIYAIDTNNKRRFLFDTGMETGKVAFSFPRPNSPFLFLAYHVDLGVHEEGNKMSGEMTNRSKDIIILKLLKTTDPTGLETLKKISYAVVTKTGAFGEGNYYPQWSKFDDLFYVKVNQNNGQPTYKFVKGHVSEYQFQPYNLPDNFTQYANSCGQKRFNALVAMGATWAEQCSQYASYLTARDAAIKGLGMGREGCKALGQLWQVHRSAISGLSRLFVDSDPHQRGGGIRPDGRWTQKGAKRDPLLAVPQVLNGLTASDIEKTCMQNQIDYDFICPI